MSRIHCSTGPYLPQQGLDFASPAGGFAAESPPPQLEEASHAAAPPGQQAGRVESVRISMGTPTVIEEVPGGQQDGAAPSPFGARSTTSEYAPTPAADKSTTPAIDALIQDRCEVLGLQVQQAPEAFDPVG